MSVKIKTEYICVREMQASFETHFHTFSKASKSSLLDFRMRKYLQVCRCFLKFISFKVYPRNLKKGIFRIPHDKYHWFKLPAKKIFLYIFKYFCVIYFINKQSGYFKYLRDLIWLICSLNELFIIWNFSLEKIL